MSFKFLSDFGVRVVNETKLFKMNTFICMYIYIHVDMHRIHALYFATPIIHIHKYMQGIYIYFVYSAGFRFCANKKGMQFKILRENATCAPVFSITCKKKHIYIYMYIYPAHRPLRWYTPPVLSSLCCICVCHWLFILERITRAFI